MRRAEITVKADYDFCPKELAEKYRTNDKRKEISPHIPVGMITGRVATQEGRGWYNKTDHHKEMWNHTQIILLG
jgi:hypothetical protein